MTDGMLLGLIVAITGVASAVAGHYAVKGVRVVVKLRRAWKRRVRHAQLEEARERAKAWEPKHLENVLWRPAGRRRKAAAPPTASASPQVQEHLGLLEEQSGRLLADIRRGLQIVDLAQRIERIHQHHRFCRDLVSRTGDAERRN